MTILLLLPLLALLLLLLLLLFKIDEPYNALVAYEPVKSEQSRPPLALDWDAYACTGQKTLPLQFFGGLRVPQQPKVDDPYSTFVRIHRVRTQGFCKLSHQTCTDS